MLFRNPMGHEVVVELPKGNAVAPPFGTVEVPDELAWVVARRGLCLQPVTADQTAEEVQSEPEATEEPAFAVPKRSKKS